MIVTKKWVAAGSTATLLAGGLFLGAPMASAAPGDAACLQASVLFNNALSAAGIDAAFVGQLEAATAAVVTAGVALETAATAAAASPEAVAAQAAIAQAETDVVPALEAVVTARTAYDAAFAAATTTDQQGDANPLNDDAVIAAQTDLTEALAAQAIIVNIGLEATAALELALNTPAVVKATTDLETTAAAADTLLQQLSGNEALAQEILTLFKAFLAACDASAIGVDPVAPVVVAPVVVPVTPVAPVTPAAPVKPAAPSTGTGAGVTAPTGTNKGLNVQTAVAAPEDNSSAIALIAALLAVGVAVPVATAARMRRLERAQG